MFGFIETGGRQFRVKIGDVIRVEKRQEAPGTQITLDTVLLLAVDGQTFIGSSRVDSKVLATIIEHDRDPKTLIFKKKRRKNYRRKKGHRQPKTLLRIDSLSVPDHGA